MADELSPHELLRRLDENAEQIALVLAKFEKLSERSEALYMPRESLELRLQHIEKQLDMQKESLAREIEILNGRLSVMQNWQTWAVRLIVGTLITVLLSTMVTAFFRVGIIG